MSAPREIIPSHYGKEIISDDHFRSANGAKDFFKRKDRSKSYEMPNVSGVRTISWNASGAYLASGSDNRVVSVGNLDPHSCRLKQTFVGYGHEDIVEAIEFAKRDEMKMASCSSDKSVRLWDLRNPSSHTKLSTPGANLFVTWSYCDNYIIFGDKSDNLGVIDARAMKTVEVFTFKDEINEFVCHPNGQLIFVATDLGKLEVLSLPKLKRIRTVQAHPPLSTCISVTLSPNERFLAVGASDACCSVWDINDMICVQTLTRLDYPVRSVSFSHCSNLIASGSEDRVIDISWTQTGEKITEIPIATECYDVAWHPKLYLLAYAISGGVGDNRSDRGDLTTLRVFGYSGLCKFICSMVMTDDGRCPSFLVRLCGWDRRVSSALASSCFYGIGLTLFGHRLDVRFVCLLFEWALHGAPWLIGSTGLLLWSYINDWPSEQTNRLCILLVGLLIDLSVVGVLKIVFRRKRPEYNQDDLLYEATFIDKFSFPSGHSSRVAMLSIFGGGFNNCHQHVPLASLFLLFFPPILAVSRVIMGRHFALDALAGLLIGINEGFCVQNIANWMFLDRI